MKPEALSYEEAAALPSAGITTLQGLRDYGRVQPGQRVLINGAAGGVGTWMGAHITGVCSTGNLQLVQSIGADSIIDYIPADWRRPRKSSVKSDRASPWYWPFLKYISHCSSSFVRL